MKPVVLAGALALLSACTATDPLGGSGTGNGGVTSGCGTFANSFCTGEVNRFRYNPTTDTITINNLPFDLSGTYARNASLDRPGFEAYENTAGTNRYVALYHQTANVQAGVVGTGDYLNYGYGGAIFGNRATINLPSSGQALYSGNYAGIRVYEGGGIGFSDGTVNMAVDFDDFDNTGAIDTVVTGRTAYDSTGASLGALPNLSVTTTGFGSGNRINQTNVVENLGGGSTGATGTMQGIFGGPSGTEVAGIIVITGADTLGSGVDVRETGSFILLRTAYTP